MQLQSGSLLQNQASRLKGGKSTLTGVYVSVKLFDISAQNFFQTHSLQNPYN